MSADWCTQPSSSTGFPNDIECQKRRWGVSIVRGLLVFLTLKILVLFLVFSFKSFSGLQTKGRTQGKQFKGEAGLSHRYAASHGFYNQDVHELTLPTLMRQLAHKPTPVGQSFQRLPQCCNSSNKAAPTKGTMTFPNSGTNHGPSVQVHNPVKTFCFVQTTM